MSSDVEGGYDSNETQYEFEDENSVVVLPEWKVFPLPDDKLPGMVTFNFMCALACRFDVHDALNILLNSSTLSNERPRENPTCSPQCKHTSLFEIKLQQILE